MGQTDHGQISRKLKGARRNSKEKIDSTGIKSDDDLIEYVTRTLVKEGVRKKLRHVDTVVNII